MSEGQSTGSLEESSLNQSSTTGEFADFPSDPSRYFEAWLESLTPSLEANRIHNHSLRPTIGEPAPGACRFEGTLRVDGYLTGSLRSTTGTLIIGEAGQVESDIVVASAIIDGCLRGDIHATERVVLGRQASMFGNIRTPALSIQPGAVFEGQCHFLPSLYRTDIADIELARSTLSMPSSADSEGVNEEEEALAVAVGR